MPVLWFVLPWAGGYQWGGSVVRWGGWGRVIPRHTPHRETET